MSLQYIKSYRGNPLLVHNGFPFCKSRQVKDTIYWKCVQFEKNCPARCVTVDDVVSSESYEHHHVVDASDLEKRNRLAVLKDTARTTQDIPAQIIAESTINMPQSVAGSFPTPLLLTRTIQRTRQEATGAPTNPQDLNELLIPESYTKTYTGEEFLRFDSGPGSNRILLFTTSENMRTLSQCDEWYADVTFKSSPPLFTQVFTVHGVKSDVTLPLVYGLLPNKEKEKYHRFLSALDDFADSEQIDFKPVSVLTDFEKGCLNAFEAVFQDSEQRGCYFHHAKCIWRQIQQNPDILTKYSSDPDFALYIRQLPAIAFVPLPDIISVFEVLKGSLFFQQNKAMLKPLMDYYEKTWIGKAARGRGRRQRPLFEHSLWNCHLTTADKNPRTNNKVEGWNRRFNTLIGMKHPTIWKFVDKLRDAQSVTELKINHILAGAPAVPRRKKYRDLEKRLLNIVEQYGSMPASDYVLGIAHNIAFYN